MRDSSIGFAWRDSELLKGHRTGVCLHGHTMHSEECLAFLPRYLHLVPGISQMVRHYERGPGKVDFSRAFWTPPLSPASALRLECQQIASLGLRPFVSLTDHDNIEAGTSLLVASGLDSVPVSVEWTVPYEKSIFHLGIHNLPPQTARQWMGEMAGYTASPREERLPGILSELAKMRETLVVFNHPLWLEEGVERGDHYRALYRFLRECIDWFHAFELNGTRRWRENSEIIKLANAHGRPLISGGDRHGCEPAACLNLTNAESFPEFVSEVRNGQSTLLFLHHYREPMALRVLETSWDILRPYPEYPGRARWTDRIFYRGLDGCARPLSLVWRDGIPWILHGATGILQLFATSPLRWAVRLLAAEQGEL